MKSCKLSCVLPLFLTLMLLFGAVQSAQADWDPGDEYKMHFPQLPNENGYDVCLCCQYLADDFVCAETGTIDDIHIWVSFKDDILVGLEDQGIWDITIREFDPSKPGNIGAILWQFMGGNIRSRAYGFGEQGWHCPLSPLTIPYDHNHIWQVNFTELAEPMTQQEGMTYWLVIKVHLQEWPPAVGWKTADTWSYPDPYTGNIFGAYSQWAIDPISGPWYPISIPSVGFDVNDLAFVITGSPHHEELDFGDAPDGAAAPMYPTLLANDGARHIIGGPWLGDLSDVPDPEPDGQPDPTAFGDDNDTISPPNDDEDGVMMPIILTTGLVSNITLEVNGGGGGVEIWIDYNIDGDWDDGGEFVYSQWLGDGIHIIPINVPAGLTSGMSFARFRISTQGTGSPRGPAQDGEVEDYEVEIEEGPQEPEDDLGDAPDSTNNHNTPMTAYPGVQADYPTVHQDGSGGGPYGPIHYNPRALAFLGGYVTLENEADIGPDEDGVNNIDPINDVPDLDIDDDGVIFPLILPHCNTTTFDFTVTANAGMADSWYVNVWFDWTRDGDWDDAPECVDGTLAPEWAVQDQVILLPTAGTFTFTTNSFLPWHRFGPGEIDPLWMRITLTPCPVDQSGSGGSGPSGGYDGGETEDYLVEDYIDPIEACCFNDGSCSDLLPSVCLASGGTPQGAGTNCATTICPIPDECHWEIDYNKWQQEPDPLAGGEHAHDSASGGPLIELHVADDWVCEGGSVTDLHWWGYYEVPTGPISGFKLTIYDQVPGSGVLHVWTKFAPIAAVNEQDSGMTSSTGETINSYEFVLVDPFLQQEGHTYWFDIMAVSQIPHNNVVWLWLHDGPVTGQQPVQWDNTGYFLPLSPDMAFVITSEPKFPENTKWVQLPDASEMGVDVCAMTPRTLADDFLCTQKGFITDVHFWCSWLDDLRGKIDRIHLSFYNDIPASGGDYSKPGDLLWEKDFFNGEFIERFYKDVPNGERWWDPCDGPSGSCGWDYQVWQIDICFDPCDAFRQWGTERDPTVYWLGVEVEMSPFYGGHFGWKSAIEQWNDNAVWRYGDASPWQELYYPECCEYAGWDMDLAFVLTTECDNCADFDDSSIVDMLDFAAFASSWLWQAVPSVPQSNAYDQADLDCDGIVNMNDFSIFASQWMGPCP